MLFSAFVWFPLLNSFFFYCSVDHCHFHSFPTRRSSDLYLFVSGVDLDVRTKVAIELGWKPISDLLEEIHEGEDRKSTRLNSSHRTISYAVFCLKKKN